MYINSLNLVNFRNYSSLSIEFDNKINVFYGMNAQGKTNIIESLYVGGFGKSFRTANDRDLVSMGENNAALGIKYFCRERKQKIDLRWNNKGKKEIKINGSRIEKLSDILGNLNVVIFSPEDLKLVKEGPSERRRFMNREISHISPNYYHHLSQYNRILTQRNNLLKQGKYMKVPMDLLDVWDEQLAEEGSIIMERRSVFIKRLNTISRLKHRKITENKENIEVLYKRNIANEENENKETIKEIFRNSIKKKRKQDFERGYTTCGPHKDDLSISINGIDVRNFGSQGQQRTAVLSLKLSEIDIVKAETGEFPILLLDDVMSELDEKRQKELIGSLKGVQVFTTMTEIPELLKEDIKDGKIFYVEKGNVSVV
ncbi:MAG TPA: DNA replication/repair protein RecF [Clostridia bacterium]|nr:DNA replication/repair protein RecF [Clostridia bacterium]